MKYDLSNEPVAVLDACALIALLNDEQGADVVAQALETIPVVRISSVNLLEVAYDAVRKTGRQEAAREIIDDVRKLGVTVDFAVSEEMIPAASVFKTSFRISLADAIALALAATHEAPVVTSDRAEFGPVEEDRAARFIWIR
jgi:PIN domain nuclease of toxin-antitoxin system